MSVFSFVSDFITSPIKSVVGAYDSVASLWGGSSSQKFERHQAEDSRNFTHQENQLQRDYETRMYRENNAYNTPEQQRQRLQEAGMNPYTSDMTTGTSSSAASAPPTQSASASANSPGAAATAAMDSDSLASISQAAKNNAEADRIEEMLPFDKASSNSNRVLADMKASLAYQETITATLTNSILEAYGMKEKEMQISDWSNKLRYGLALAINEEKRKDVIDASVDQLKKLANLNDEQAKQIHEYVTKYMANDFFTNFALRGSQVRANDAAAANSYASAEEHAALAYQIRELTPEQKKNIAADTELKKVSKKLTNLDFSIRSKTRTAEWKANLSTFNRIIQENKHLPNLAKARVAYYTAEAFAAQERGDYEGVRAWNEVINGTANTIINGVETYGAVKRAKAPVKTTTKYHYGRTPKGGSYLKGSEVLKVPQSTW